jgi:hypothetical protein
VRHILPTIRVPTLVLHRTGDRALLVDEGRYVASLIPHARFVELPGDDHLPFVGDQDQLLDEIERFLASSRTRIDTDRALVTILCGAPDNGAPKGDRTDPAPSLATVRALVADHAARFGGSAVRISDGRVFGVFDGPARAIRCACAIGAEARQSNTSIRLGLHTGECDIVGGTPQGVVVEIGGNVAALAQPGEVLVTRTVVDLVAGSGLRFADRGMHALAKGHKGWRVYAVREE